ncbi:MAG: hypothetical protein KAJ06_00685 [Gammaproteobacteria bacterium]|nr:hypothetical protein [Gammaproteobacteria bacterium]
MIKYSHSMGDSRKAPGRNRRSLGGFICFTVLAMLLVSCGGGGGGGGGIVADGGIGGTGISQGPVSGFGSVFVNGIEHFLGSANILINGQPAPNGETDLKLGMVVRVAGNVNQTAGTGTATDVAYAQNLEGPIDSIDLATNTMVVLGQTVVVDVITVFDGAAGLMALMAGDVVEISGLVDGSFVIHATRVDVETDTGLYELSGTIVNQNAVTMTFDIGGQTVDYSAVTTLDVPGGVPANGLFVRVQGTRPGGTGTPLLAGSAKADDLSPNAVAGEDLEVEGFITDFVSPVQFSVSGQAVRTSAQTGFDHGVINDLGDGVHIEVEGSIANDNVLDADEISFKGSTSVRGESGEIEIHADIEAVDPSAGTITIFGSSIILNSSTQLEDERDKLVPFGITDLAVGDRVDVKAFLDITSGDVIAESLHRKNAKADVELEAPVDAVDAILETVTLFGVLVTTDLSTVYRDKLDNIITSAAFFTGAQLPGALVESKGTLVGITILASELELDD